MKSKAKKAPKVKTSMMDIFFRDYYTPFLMNDLVGFSVVVLFSALLGSSIYAISKANVGLDQNLSVRVSKLKKTR